MPVLAIGGVDIVVFVLALVALLIVAGGWALFQPLALVLRHVPVIGGSIADTVNGVLEVVMQSIIASYSVAMQAMAHLFWALGTGIWHLMFHSNAAVKAVNNTAGAALGIAQGAAGQISSAVDGALSTAEQFATHEAVVAEGYADGLAATAAATAAADLTTALDHADGLYNTAIGTAESLYNTSIAHADDLYNQAVGVAEGLSTAAAQDAIGVAQNLYNQAIGYTTGVEDVLNAHIDDILNEAESFAGSAAAAAAAAATAGLLTRVGTLEAEATECLEPLCDTITPNAPNLGDLGSLLKTLEGLAEVGVLTALLAAAVADPKAAANDVVDVMGWVAPLGTSLVDAVGVHL